VTEVSEAAIQLAYEKLRNEPRDLDAVIGTLPQVRHTAALQAFARYIEWASGRAKEVRDQGSLNSRQLVVLNTLILPEPVDPLLIEARNLAAEHHRAALMPGVHRDEHLAAILRGDFDDVSSSHVPIVLTALKRGMELTRADYDQVKAIRS